MVLCFRLLRWRLKSRYSLSNLTPLLDPGLAYYVILNRLGLLSVAFLECLNLFTNLAYTIFVSLLD
jgi:hypothetical protein